MSLNEKDLAQRKAAADAMGVRVEDIRLVRGIPEYQPKLPKRNRSHVRAEKFEQQAGKHVFVIGQGR